MFDTYASQRQISLSIESEFTFWNDTSLRQDEIFSYSEHTDRREELEKR